MRSAVVVVALLIAVACGLTTCHAVLAEKPIGDDGLVLHFFEGAPPAYPLRAIVDEGGAHRLLEAPSGDRAALPAGTTLVTSTPASERFDDGKVSLRARPVTVDGRAAVRFTGGSGDGVSSYTARLEGGDVVWLSAADYGQLGPLLALADGGIVAAILCAVGVLLSRLVPKE